MHQLSLTFSPHFDGKSYDANLDHARLTKQLDRVRTLMSDGLWRSLSEIAAATGDGEASVSARLRDMCKPKHGGLTVERRRFDGGLWKYRVGK